MKLFFVTGILMMSLSLFGLEVRVLDMKKEQGMDRSFLLKTNVPQVVRLDCQSFIQGLRLGEGSLAQVFLLDPYECESLYLRMRDTLRGGEEHCLEVEDTIRWDRICY